MSSTLILIMELINSYTQQLNGQKNKQELMKRRMAII